jgi:hypothetical protein
VAESVSDLELQIANEDCAWFIGAFRVVNLKFAIADPILSRALGEL